MKKEENKFKANLTTTHNNKQETETIKNNNYVVHDMITTTQESISEIRVENNENGYLDLDSLLNNSNKNVNEKVSSVKQLSLFNEKKSQIENQKENIQHKQQNEPKQNNTSPDVMINKVAQNENKSNETNFNETKIKANEVINRQKEFELLQQFEEKNGKLKLFELNINEPKFKHQTNVNKEENNEWLLHFSIYIFSDKTVIAILSFIQNTTKEMNLFICK
jgi:hypothetical protein